jgi:hypothetical protein
VLALSFLLATDGFPQPSLKDGEQLYAGFLEIVHELLLQIVWRMLNPGLLVSIKLNKHASCVNPRSIPVQISQFHIKKKPSTVFFLL